MPIPSKRLLNWQGTPSERESRILALDDSRDFGHRHA